MRCGSLCGVIFSRLNFWAKCSEILSGIRIQLSDNHARHGLPGYDSFGAAALTSEDLVYKARSGHIVNMVLVLLVKGNL